MDAASQIPSLEYDRGTIVLTALASTTANRLAGLIKWDNRIEAWRAPAYLYASITRNLNQTSTRFLDRVRKPLIPEGNWKAIDLRPYQDAALLAWRAAGGRGLICLPTGAGKTRVALAAAQRSRKASLILVPTRVLLHQWVSAIAEVYSGAIGVFGDGQHELRPITVTTFESGFRNGWSFGQHFDLLIVDEVHHFGDAERDEAIESCPAPFRLGLSATLDGSHVDRLTELVGPKIFEQQVGDLVGSALANFDLTCLHLPLTKAERVAYDAEYRVFRTFFDAFRQSEPKAPWEYFARLARQTEAGRAALAAFRRARLHVALTEQKQLMLCQLLDRHRHNRKLIFTSDSRTAFCIAKQFLVAPITAEIGKRERATLLSAFREGQVKTLVACKVLNEGLDVPEAEVAIVVGGSGATREHIQRVGRVLRRTPEKHAQVYELLAADTLEVGQSRRRGRRLKAHREERHGV
jgi:superfamily II DNA or RNA helicase